MCTAQTGSLTPRPNKLKTVASVIKGRLNTGSRAPLRTSALARAPPRPVGTDLRPQNAGWGGEVGLGAEDSGRRRARGQGALQDSRPPQQPERQARNQSALPFWDVVSALLLGWGTGSEVPAATISTIMPLVHVGAEMPPNQRQACQSGQSGDFRTSGKRRRIQNAGKGTHHVDASIVRMRLAPPC